MTSEGLRTGGGGRWGGGWVTEQVEGTMTVIVESHVGQGLWRAFSCYLSTFGFVTGILTSRQPHGVTSG